MAKRKKKTAAKSWPRIDEHEGLRKALAARETIRDRIRAVDAEKKRLAGQYKALDRGDIDGAVEALLGGDEGAADIDVEVPDRAAVSRQYKALEIKASSLEKMAQEVEGRIRKEHDRAAKWLGEELHEEYAALIATALPLVEELQAVAEQEAALRRYVRDEDARVRPAAYGTGLWRSTLGPLAGIKSAWMASWLDRARRLVNGEKRAA